MLNDAFFRCAELSVFLPGYCVYLAGAPLTVDMAISFHVEGAMSVNSVPSLGFSIMGATDSRQVR